MQEQVRKKCIFHATYPIVDNGNSASAIRPYIMLNTLKEMYDVYEITGYGKERQAKFKLLKEKTEKGEKFEFIYSESSTMPNALTEKNHLPKYPCLEKNIFKFCKKNHIVSTYFYRDIYWKFPVYNNSVKLIKRLIAKFFYRFDLKMLNKHVDILYLPSMKMNEYIKFSGVVKELPPGSFLHNISETTKRNNELMVFYVGAVSGNCDMKKAIDSFNGLKGIRLVLCCPKEDWLFWSQKNNIKCDSNIEIIHKRGKEIEEHLLNSDVGLIFNEPNGYREFAIPVKMFEYMTYHLPIIATKNSAAGNFVEKHGLGWSIEYKKNALTELLENISVNRNEIEKIKHGMITSVKEHTWIKRVEQISIDVKNLEELKGL